jgi:NAD kinase
VSVLFDKIVVVTRETEVEKLRARWNTKAMAKFFIASRGGDFGVYESADQKYHAAMAKLRAAIPEQVRSQWIERAYLPTFSFGKHDLVITLGPDGLVVNTAKYLESQPLLALNPDPATVDGVLIPFSVEHADSVVLQALQGQFRTRAITMAQAALNDGRTILAVNDLFVGQKTHVSARYLLKHGKKQETQSSSGIIVSTGAGSTGWHRSILAGAAGVLEPFASAEALKKARTHYRFEPDDKSLVFHVREPFESRTSAAQLVRGQITAKQPLIVESQMPKNGVIFSDGVEEDFLEFNSGAIATVSVAARHLQLMQRATKASR